MSDVIIKAEGLGKSYIIGHNNPNEKYTTLRDAATRSIKGFVKKSADIFKGNAIIAGDTQEEFWALKDLDFEIKRGDAVGIIGRNGAGKSTLLKVLSRITEPTLGRVTITGRIASLLEVGTGFHPELSGRDNIFLNGAILGMSRAEIRAKFDEIVDFAGVERFLDTPVKKYSSGMYVRLAFAVAAHLEPEILVVDEVLAVGDAEFQKKCLGKMDEVSKKEGRTVLFVSHNMQAVSTLCNKGIVLNKGTLGLTSNIHECINYYNQLANQHRIGANISLADRLERSSGLVRFTDIVAIDKTGATNWIFSYNEEVQIKISCSSYEDIPNLTFYLGLISSKTDEMITNFKTEVVSHAVSKGEEIAFSVQIPANTIRPGQYNLYMALGDSNLNRAYDIVDRNVDVPMLNIIPSSDDRHENYAYCSIPYTIKIND